MLHRLIATLAASALLAACSLFGLREQVQAIDAHGVAAVRVVGATPGQRVFVVAWSWVGGHQELLGLHPARADGRAWFVLDLQHRYHFGAFADLDGDGCYDDGEPSASTVDLAPLPLAGLDQQPEPIVLRLDARHRLPIESVHEAHVAPSELGAALEVQSGEIAPLDAPRFQKDVGELGMWKPFDFLGRYGIGTWFIEPYDPSRTPVVFVHGINAAPGDFAALVGALDRERFQAWLFQYPSGFRLESVQAALASSLQRLRERHGLRRVVVVAHSMGGLVARGAIAQLAREAGDDFVPLFVTISTPWGGHEAATIGVDMLSYPVPSWRDMVPDSDYLRALLATPLPAGTRHELVFGFCSESGIGLPNDNDGVVGVASQLEPSVQVAASRVFGLPFAHRDILEQEQLLRHVCEVLVALPPGR